MKALFSISLVTALCLTSCLEEGSEGVSAEEYEYLEEEKDVLKRDLEKAYLELDEYDAKFTVFEELEKRAKSADVKEKELEELRKEKEETEERMRELRKEFDAYQKKYEAKVRTEAKGEKFASLEVAGRTLEEVEISSVTPSEVRIRHASGFATLNHKTAPLEWKERFFLRSEEEIAQREQELAAFIAPPVAEVEGEEKKTERELSDYQKRRIQLRAEEEEMKTLEGRVEKAVVIISGNGGEGSGFFAQDGITTYLYTAAHVLDGNSQLKIVDAAGKEWKRFGGLEVAEGLDLARLAVAEPVEHLLALRPIGETPEIGTSLAALGNANGGGVITKEVGKLRGVGPTSYEISSSVLQGNSGGPVMNSAGEVLAVVTHLMRARDDIWAEGTSSSKVRRFACRVDVKISWKKTSLGGFVTAQEKIDRFDGITRLMYALAALTPTTGGFSLDTRTGGGQTVLEILQENKDLNVVKQLLDINDELMSKKMRVSERDLRKKFRSFYSSVHRSAADQSLRASSFSPYHAEEVKASLKFRQGANEAIVRAIDNLKD